MSLSNEESTTSSPADITAAMSLERLVSLFFAHQGKVVDKWEQYLSIYASEFTRFLNQSQPVRLLEIGVQNGGSLELWAKYLPKGSEIVGLDIDPAVEKLHFDQPIKVVVADVKDTERRDLLLGDEPFDIIIDDGSHHSDDIIQAFRSLFYKLRPGGVYIVEDLHASYWEGLGGGFRRPGSAIEFFKDKVDSLAIDYFEANAKAHTDEFDELQGFGRWIDRVVFYDSIVVVQKRLFAKTSPYRRLLSGVTSLVTNPASELLTAPSAMVRELRLGPATSKVLHEELLTRLITELKVQGDLKASSEELRAQLKAQALEHALNLELCLKETDKLRCETARLSEELSEKNDLTDLMNTERQTFGATIERLSFAQQSLSLALERAISERDSLQNLPLRSGYRLLKASESFIRHRLKASRPAAELLEAPPVQSKEAIDPEQLIAQSGLFDDGWYRSQLPEETKSVANAIQHYVSRGAAEGLDPHPLFDTSWYVERYHLEPGTNPLVHYLMHGTAEELYPNPLFDTGWYLSHYPDIRAAGINPLVHYAKHGAAEGRDPNPFFDSDWYLEQHEDVKRAGLNPLMHYLHHGEAEGRDPSWAFSIRWYRENYLKEDDQSLNALDHYIRVGKRAGFEPRSPNAAYVLEVVKQEQAFSADLPEIEQHISAMVIKPRFLILIHDGDPVLKKETETCIQTQVYQDYLTIDSPFLDTEQRFDTEASPYFFIQLSAGDHLHNLALYAFASAINSNPTLEIVYADDDHLDDAGIRSQPFFKPDWSPDYLESMNYIGASACFRWSLAQPHLRQGSRGYDLILRLTEIAKTITHVRQVLLHRKYGYTPSVSVDSERDAEALEGRLRRTGRAGEIQPILPNCRCYDVKIRLFATPLVSVIIPTAGKSVDLDGQSTDLLINCLDTIAARSSYKNLEFVVVDNGDLNAKQRAYLKNYGAKSITFRKRKFNVAEKLNLGASIATGDLFLLLNDDVEPINSSWIERLVEHFEKPHVGVVGAKLLYKDETIQHVGVVLNGSNPDHARRLRPRDDLGYYFSTVATRNFSAVTGACMMTRASNYRILGGYSESLAVSFNDVDFCLRTIESGLTVVYAPGAELIHYESQSRVAELNMDELQFFYKRWSHFYSDPFYNESELAVAPPTFEVRHNPRAF